jgi:2-dehydropantoate 2-reductase
MRILIYGAGVQGSYLAHKLVRGGNDVTLLARGIRVEELQKDGIVIRHYFQCHTTVDRTNVISALRPDDVYDLIFVVMLYSDLQAVLPILAANQSRYIIFVGNNPNGHGVQDYLKANSPTEKQIAFGFQATGGRRDKDRMICVRGSGSMDLGDLDGDLSWRPLIAKAFESAHYTLTFHHHMDDWLKTHIVVVAVMFYVSCLYEGHLRNMTGDTTRLNQIIGAVDEGFKVLETLNYRIIPAGQAQFVRQRRGLLFLLVKMFTATPLTRLFDAMSPFEVMMDEALALNTAFNEWKKQANILTPNWDALQSYVPNMQPLS